MNEMKRRSTAAALDLKLRESALLSRRVDADYLLLADATLVAAIDGSRHLSAAERSALNASPLTLRRFRTLVQQHAASKAPWQGSHGMLRAADSGDGVRALVTDDGHFSLHFVGTPGAWQVVLQLDAAAPFAAQLLGTGAVLAARDGAGSVIVQGVLDADGECEQAWTFGDAPASHLQRHGAVFTVAPVPA